MWCRRRPSAGLRCFRTPRASAGPSTQFAYIVSHDLRAPLRAIDNLSEWIEEELGSGLTATAKDYMRLLRARVLRMESMIMGILEYSRIGKTEAVQRQFKVADSLNDIVDSLGSPPGFTVEISPGMPTLTCSKICFEQVMANLIGNAIKHHDKAQGKVSVSVKDVGEFYEFAVADDGPGIAPKHHKRIFDIFQTLQSRDEREGVGIGLTLVKKIIEEQGGAITLESDLGQGVLFRFTWPKVTHNAQVNNKESQS